MIVLSAVILLGGALSLLAGGMDRRRIRRIRAGGETAWATIAAAPKHPEYEPSAYRPLLLFDTADGRPVEVFSPSPPSRRRPLTEGRKILVYFDPDDPTQVVLHGSRDRADLAFIAVGGIAVLGAVVAMVLA